MMAKNSKQPNSIQASVVEIKSKFDAEFRRFSVNKEQLAKCEEFYEILKTLHKLEDIPFIVCYTDPIHGDLLPINNDDNYAKALCSQKQPLRLLLQRKGECWGDLNGYGNPVVKRRNPISKIISGDQKPKPRPNISISMPEDFRRVSAIIDVDVVPETHRRVKLMKNGTDKPLGFYIRDGTSVRVTNQGMEKVPGIFISRLVPGGLAESTGLLAVNDEVLEVNGIEVAGKTLDQVTDMMVANSSNLIVTVKPVNQRWTLARSEAGRHSQKSIGSLPSAASAESAQSDEIREVDDEINEEEDEVKDHLDESPARSEKSETTETNTVDTTSTVESKSDKEDKDSAVVTL